jgi:hypothetical protein
MPIYITTISPKRIRWVAEEYTVLLHILTVIPDGKHYMTDLGVNRIILKRILKTSCERVWTGFKWFRTVCCGGLL